MTTHTAPHSGSWLQGLKNSISGLFHKPEAHAAAKADVCCPPGSEPTSSGCAPITTEEAVDTASEDSFPASDPPSYTGSSAQ